MAELISQLDPETEIQAPPAVPKTRRSFIYGFWLETASEPTAYGRSRV